VRRNFKINPYRTVAAARGYFHGVASTDEMTILVAGMVVQVAAAPLMGAQFALAHSNVVAVFNAADGKA
jgi:hypothetical protein